MFQMTNSKIIFYSINEANAATSHDGKMVISTLGHLRHQVVGLPMPVNEPTLPSSQTITQKCCYAVEIHSPAQLIARPFYVANL